MFLRYLHLYFLILILNSYPISAQQTDDDSIHFQTETERTIIENYFSGDKDYFMLFYAMSEEDNLSYIQATCKSYLDRISKYKSEPYTKMKAKKLSKVIYKDIHDFYLKKYEENVLFPKIFDRGIYNCVTSSALFAICFEELELDYTIKLMPQHIYLVLFPDQDAIKIETTNPTEGIIVHDSRFKKQYVEFLHDRKLITKTEFDTRSIDDLFQENYYSEEDISIEELVGIHYYNCGVDLFLKEEYQSAFNQFEKALLFFPNDRVRFMARITINNLILLGGMKTVDNVKLLVKYPKYVALEGEKSNVIDLFGVFTNEVLIQNNDTSSYIEGYDYISSHLKDTSFMQEISHIFYTEMARYHYRTGNTPEATEYIEKALILNPDNVETQTALIEIIFSQMTSKPVGVVFSNALAYYNKYRQLRDNNAFVTLLTSVALTGASQSFSLNRSKEALEYLGEFEKIFRQDLEVNSYLISESYIAAAVYYFGKGQKTTARSYIDKGLKYSPGNYQLLKLRNSF